jgi:hypothetical protein
LAHVSLPISPCAEPFFPSAASLPAACSSTISLHRLSPGTLCNSLSASTTPFPVPLTCCKCWRMTCAAPPPPKKPPLPFTLTFLHSRRCWSRSSSSGSSSSRSCWRLSYCWCCWCHCRLLHYNGGSHLLKK